MKLIIYLPYVVLFLSFTIGATESIPLGNFEENDDMVLVEDTCKDPEIPCSQIYVPKDDVEQFKKDQLKNKLFEEAKRIHAIESVPTKTEIYQRLLNAFDKQEKSGMIRVWVHFSENTSSEFDKQNNLKIGNEILDSLEPSSYILDDHLGTDLELGYISVQINRQALTDLYNSSYITSITIPT